MLVTSVLQQSLLVGWTSNFAPAVVVSSVFLSKSWQPCHFVIFVSFPIFAPAVVVSSVVLSESFQQSLLFGWT